MSTNKSDFLCEPISNFLKRKAVTIDSTASILTGLELMCKEKISSIPVWHAGQKKFLGFVDILDIIKLVGTMSQIPELVKNWLGQREVSEDTWRQFIETEHQQLRENKVGDLLELSGARNAWNYIEEDMQFKYVMDFLNHDSKIHRLAVLKKGTKDQLVGVVSQSLILEILGKHIDEGFDLPVFQSSLEAVSKTISGWEHKLVTANVRETALEGYIHIIENDILGIAIVDDENTLVGSLSCSDLKASEPYNLFTDLYLPLPQYLEKSAEWFPRYDSKSLLPITVSMSESIKSVIQKIAKNRIHRIFVVDKSNKLLNILALGEILSVIERDVK